MLEETKVEFNVMYALRCGINSDNLPQIVKIFAANEYLSPDNYFPGGCSTLHYACSMGAIECVNYFLKECKCDINSINSPYGMTPVHMAAIHGKIELIDLLHSFKADLYKIDNQEENIIHKALLTGDLGFVKNLIENYRIEDLLIKTDRNNARPDKFLQELISKGLHPKQLSKDSEENNLMELLEYVKIKTNEFEAWRNRKYFLQLRLRLKNSLC